MKLQFIFLSYVKFLFTSTSTAIGEIKNTTFKSVCIGRIMTFNKVAMTTGGAVEATHDIKRIQEK